MARNPDATLVEIGGKTIKIQPAVSTKSDTARALLEMGYTVSDISKAVPMAYSQVHSIWRKMVPTGEAKSSLAGQRGSKRGVYEKVTAARAAVPPLDLQTDHRFKPPKTNRERIVVDRILKREKANEAAGRPAGTGAKSARVGKLRIGNLPHDIDVGPCANCGHDLVIRKSPQGLIFVHVNTTAEEYLSTVQFCLAVPEKLVK